ncbi:sodium:proton antiporter [Rubrobacter marinus]|uniref:Sodium:proton antiporter n=1 Tax=Rubrobacter marinus TaxID=2653852 RepID=A0A6G8PYS3_9ACTN|nr:MnhB domain-containing protein [Rubrobacter marinus]QIN79346.1 sodium:proton antiporter [Rubrobacter marinus]
MKNDPTSILTQVVARILLLPTVVAAIAILVKGYASPGDGFAAGVVASLGVLLQHIAHGRGEAERLGAVRYAPILAGAGLLLSLLVAIVPLVLGDAVLTHYPPPGASVVYLGTLELITPVLFDLGIFLLVFGFVVGTITFFARTISEEREYAGPGGEHLDLEDDA